MKLIDLSRKNVTRQLFEAITAVGFHQWWQSEIAAGLSRPETKEQAREAYNKMFKREYWSEFQTLTVNAPLERLQDSLADWVKRGDALGLLEWRAQNAQREKDDLER